MLKQIFPTAAEKNLPRSCQDLSKFLQKKNLANFIVRSYQENVVRSYQENVARSCQENIARSCQVFEVGEGKKGLNH
jgi:hypothetical protein